MHDFIVNIIPSLQHLNSIGYLIVFLGSLLESIVIAGYIVPGSTIIIVFGLLAGGGYYDVGDVLFFSILGNILGNLLSFYIGRRVGKIVFKEGFYFIKAEHLKKADNFLKLHGGKSILLGKLIPGIKENIPFVAGIFKMGIGKFLFYNILGGIIWSLIFVGFGYIFSSSLVLAEAWATRFGYIILLLLLLFLLIYLIKYIFLKYGNISLHLFKDAIKFLFERFLSIRKVKIFIKKNPNKIFFLKNRISKRYFLGLPFTILSILIIYILIEYIGMTDAILDKSLITQVDIRLSEFFYYFKDTRLIYLFLSISYFGNIYFIIIITFITSIVIFLKNKRIEIIGLLTSILTSIVVATLSKIIVHRPRPEYAVYKEIGYSFPSFHATISVSLYGFIIFLFLTKIKKMKMKINIIFIGIIIALLIGFSRLYLNVHYLSDVIAGWFLGFLGLIFGITINGYLNYIYKNKKKLCFKKIKNVIIYIIIIIGIIFSIFNYHLYLEKIIFTNKSIITYIKLIKINDLFKNNSQLKYTETITGRRTEPLNFIFITKDKKSLEKLFYKSGWSLADKLGRKSINNMGEALLDNKKYENAPITPLYWNKKIQTYGFQKLTKEDTIKVRHHIRIWNTGYKIGIYYIFVGSGIYDDGLKWGITHKIDPNLDKEREYIFNSLSKSHLIKSGKKIKLEVGFNGVNFSGDYFFTDGKIYIIKIK